MALGKRNLFRLGCAAVSCCALPRLGAAQSAHGPLCTAIDPPRQLPDGPRFQPFAQIDDGDPPVFTPLMGDRLVREYHFTPFGVSMAPDRWLPKDGMTPQSKVTLGVHFLAATPEEQVICAQAVDDWARNGVQNYLEFRLGVAAADAQIRVHFGAGRDGPGGWRSGNWSLIGRQAKSERDLRRPTMNIALGQPDYIVKHEFGHALGLRHEHQHPDGAIRWKDDIVIAAMKERYGWQAVETRKNILEPFAAEARCVSDPNPNFDSVMMYDFPADWNYGRVQGKMGPSITHRDRLCVRGLYSL